jgi:hypothetical protein
LRKSLSWPYCWSQRFEQDGDEWGNYQDAHAAAEVADAVRQRETGSSRSRREVLGRPGIAHRYPQIEAEEGEEQHVTPAKAVGQGREDERADNITRQVQLNRQAQIGSRISRIAARHDLGAGLDEGDGDVEEGEEEADANDADKQVGKRPDRDAVLACNDGSACAARSCRRRIREKP